MDRRMAGLVVLVLVLTAVVVVPTINGRRIVGFPVAVSLPDPPADGSCVQSPFPAAAQRSGAIPQISVTEVVFGSCTDLIRAEVVGLQVKTAVLDPGSWSSSGPCSQQVASYVGLPQSDGSAWLPDGSANNPVSWKPTIGFDAYAIVPGDVQRRAGQTWAACVAVPTSHVPYQVGLRHAYTTGRLPSQFGLCWTTTDLDEQSDLLPCDEPHPAELLATGWIENRSLITLPQLDASCRDIAGQILRTDDPTHNGMITIVMDPVRRDGQSKPDAPLAINCFAMATTGASLTGTLIGLADGPVPLTG